MIPGPGEALEVSKTLCIQNLRKYGFFKEFLFSNIGAAGLNIQNYTKNFELKFLGGLEFCSRSGLPLQDKEMC